jgi:ankyrin repeat protein
MVNFYKTTYGIVLVALAGSLERMHGAQKSKVSNKVTHVQNHSMLDQALYESIMSNDQAKVETLCEQGASVNVRYADGVTPLMIAACRGYITIVEFLLDKGAVIDLEDTVMETALDKAVLMGHQDVVKLLSQKAQTQAPAKDRIAERHHQELISSLEKIVKLLEKWEPKAQR